MNNCTKLLPSLFILSIVFSTISYGQNDQKGQLKTVFVDLEKHQGWGPFSPREGFEAQYYTATFTVSGQDYKVYQLLHPQTHYEQRFIIRKASAEMRFTEEQGAIVYNRREEINLEGIQFDIVGYSQKADQFVLIEKEEVNYVYQGLKPNTEAPLFKENRLNGQQLSLSEYKGRYVLLDFWGTWCGPCLRETPFLKDAYQKFGTEIEFIGIAVDYEEQRVQKYIQKENIEWPQIFIDKSFTNTHPLIKEYNVYGYPAMFLINPEGKIIIGPENESKLRGERLAETLKKILSK